MSFTVNSWSRSSESTTEKARSVGANTVNTLFPAKRESRRKLHFRIRKEADEWSTFMFRIGRSEVRMSARSPVVLTEIFRSIPQSPKGTNRILLYIIPRPLPSIPFRIHRPLIILWIDAFEYELLKAFLNKSQINKQTNKLKKSYRLSFLSTRYTERRFWSSGL